MGGMKLRWAAAGPAFVAAYFLALTFRAVYTYLTPDDFLAIYQSWAQPLRTLIKANILFFLPTDIPRPMSALWYRLLYAVSGLHPAPFKIVNLVILVASIFLTYAVARRLAESRTAGTLTALLLAYHGEAVNLYSDTGYEADVLCYFFYFCAVFVYLRARVENRFPSSRELAVCCALYVCALNSKELAVTLPVFLLLYELIYHRRDAPWSWRHGLGILATGVITLALLIGKMLAPISLMNNNVMYRPTITWAQFMKTSLEFTGHLFLRPGFFTPATLILLWLVLAAIAWLSRSHALRFAWLFLMLSPLPVAFIPPRGVAQYYIPRFGWSLYAGVLINLGLSAILRRFPSARPVRRHMWAGAAVVVLLAAISYPFWRAYQPWNPTSVVMEGEMNRSVVRQLHHLEPQLPHDSRLLFLDDPYRPYWYNLTFVARLLYRDRSIVVHRAKPEVPEMERPREALTSATLASYDHVIDYRGGYFRELRAPWDRGPMPAVVLEWGQPQIFHADWTPVDRGDPARAGESLIVKALDLGETLPPVAPGQPFPQSSPYARVVTDVRARFNGTRAEVQGQIGWPGEINRYRVDIRVPGRVSRGLSWLDLSANGITGPAIEIAVQ
jgi:hypothetical protein